MPDDKGFCLWFTGLSGAGKTTITNQLVKELRSRGSKLEVLDGDIVRENLSKGLGFSKEDRDTNIRRIAFVANLLSRNGVPVITAAISPYREIRDEARKKMGDRFIEVYTQAPLEVCEERDVKGLSSSTPIVVFAHIPLWSVYPEWGWGTDDSARALSFLKRFGSVSVLNGHIHQVMQKVEGNVTFHTAMSTAFPQPAPGSAPSPGPMKVEADRLKKILGLARMSFHDVNHPIAITDVPLENEMSAAAGAAQQVVVDNFSFAPATTAVGVGTTITWTNRDDVPHNVVSTEKKFASPVLDTDEQFSHSFDAAGTYKYYCSIHPKMTGQVVVG